MSNIEAYLQARVEFLRVADETRALAIVLATAANALRDQPDRMGFSNSGGLPLEAFMSRDSVSINADDWRSPDQIVALLSRYHAAKANMNTLWNSISPDLRSGLQRPSPQDDDSRGILSVNRGRSSIVDARRGGR